MLGVERNGWVSLLPIQTVQKRNSLGEFGKAEKGLVETDNIELYDLMAPESEKDGDAMGDVDLFVERLKWPCVQVVGGGQFSSTSDAPQEPPNMLCFIAWTCRPPPPSPAIASPGSRRFTCTTPAISYGRGQAVSDAGANRQKVQNYAQT
jgi:hypothetical protein